MFTKGQQVVCIDDNFPNPLKKLYRQLPVRDVAYTVREVYVGRSVAYGQPGASDGEIGVLLNEIVNYIDPRCKNVLELGFKAERFAPVEHDTETNTEKVEDTQTV
jgi:hypothetical protein